VIINDLDRNEQFERECKLVSDNYQRKLLKTCTWFEYNPDAFFAFTVFMGSRLPMLNIIAQKLERNRLYNKIELKAEEIIKDPEIFSLFMELEINQVILTVYDGRTIWFDEFSEEYRTTKYCNGKEIDGETIVTIYVIDEHVGDNQALMWEILNNEELYGVNLFELIAEYNSRDFKYTVEQSTFINAYIRQMRKRVKSFKPISHPNFVEKDLERLLVRNLDVLESGLKLIKNQYEIQNGFIDILAEDENGVKCIIELKIDSGCKDIVFQSAYYPTQFDEPVRMITISPGYKDKIHSALKNIGNVEMYTYYFIDDELFIEKYELPKSTNIEK
jgi:hypothetical protein